MKPEKLRMVNFGPFRDETVDFTSVSAMFLVTGKTGSGKTMIFDAMTFALYGKYSGSRSKLTQEQMRSSFAAPGEQAFVEFTFSVTGHDGSAKKFRIRRTLPTDHTSKSGTVSKKPSESSLQFLNGGKWQAYCDQKEISDKIEKEIIRLKFSDFSKIVILPQGEFANFLRMNSNERTEALKTLFPQKELDDLAQKIKNRADEAQQQLSKAEDTIADLGGAANIPVLSEEIGKLSSEIGVLSEKSRKLDAKIQESTEKIARADERLSNTRKAAAAQQAVARLEAERADIERTREMLGKAERASKIAPLITNAGRAEKALVDAKNDVSRAEANLRDAKAAEQDLSAREEENEEKRGKIRDYERDAESTGATIEKLESLAKAEEEKTRAENELARFRDAAAADRRALETEREALLAIAEESGIGGISPESVPQKLLEKVRDLEGEKHRSETSLKTAREAEKRRRQIGILTEAEADSAAEKEQADRNLAATKEILESLEAQQAAFERNNAASVLARALRPGIPCPVCGSKEHPFPAKEGGTSLEDKIAAQKANVATAEEKASAANAKLISVKSTLDAEKAALSQIERDADGTIPSEKEAESAFGNAIALLADAESRYSRAADSAAKISELAEKVSGIAKTESELSIKAEKAATILQETKKTIDGSHGTDKESLKLRLESIMASIAEARAQVELFDDMISAARGTVKTDEALLENCGERLAQAKADAAEATSALDEKIAETEFESADDARKWLLGDGEKEAAQNRISRWESELSAQNAIIASVGSDDDEESLARLLSDLRDSREKARNEKAAADNEKAEKTLEMERMIDKRGILSAAVERRARIEKEEGAAIRLSNDLAGKNPKKTQFSSWILAMYFSEVVEFANERFFRLSGGRYMFRIETGGSKGKQGLDIAIEDYSLGKTRPPSTLSGGETFQASISLALALTDVVCNHSGGIRLDSIFIDEGFGTLDPESLDKALETLTQIQGQRMVGLISHVEAMEMEIKSHVVVDKASEMNSSTIRIENWG